MSNPVGGSTIVRQLSEVERIDRIAFITALTVLSIAGIAVLAINYRTESRRKRYLRVIAQSLWKFTPEVHSKRSEYVWSWWKLLCAGLMLSCLIVSVSVYSIHFVRAVPAAVLFFSAWLLFITAYWYWYVVPFFDSRKKSEAAEGSAAEKGSSSTSSNNSTAAAAAAPATQSGPGSGSGTGSKSTPFTQHISLMSNSNSSTPTSAAVSVTEDTRLPLTIITGYLGAGKTTLVKHLLHNSEGYKVLVIENEVGDEGVDHDLLLQQTAKENIILMNNGCICCSVRKDVIDTFHALFKQIENLQREIDWVVIETTGLADPAPLVLSLYMDETCRKALRLDGVLTVVDCINLRHHVQMHAKDKNKGTAAGTGDKDSSAATAVNSLRSAAARLSAGAVAHDGSDVGEVVKQVAFADRVLLNKVDLLGKGDDAAAQLRAITAMVVGINPTLASAPVKRKSKTTTEPQKENEGADSFEQQYEHVLPCARGVLPLSQLLNIQAFDANRCGNALLAQKDAGTEGVGAEGEVFCQPINVTRLGADGADKGEGALRQRGQGKKAAGGAGANNAATIPRNVPSSGNSSGSGGSSGSTTAGVQTLSLVSYDALDFDAVNMWLVELLQTRGQDIYRLKGILNIAGYAEQFVVQGVHMLFDGCRGQRWDALEGAAASSSSGGKRGTGTRASAGEAGTVRRSKLVFIGVNMDEHALRADFLDCRAVLVRGRALAGQKSRRDPGQEEEGGGLFGGLLGSQG